MKIITLGSGSKGNSLLACSGATKILIDAGLPYDELLRRFDKIGENPADLNALLITHTHGDHVRCARRLANHYQLQVYCSEKAFAHPYLKKIHKKNAYENRKIFHVENMEIFPFRLPHDADPTFGFRIQAEGKTFGIVTDLGEVQSQVIDALKNCETLLLEFNHDVRMLESGPYPWRLKNRIASQYGHLSNRQAAQLLKEVLHAQLENLILGHLSETNNRYALAYQAASNILTGEGLHKTNVTVAAQDQVGQAIAW